MELLEFILGFLGFCAILTLLSNACEKGDEYAKYLKEEYGMEHHEYHN